MGIMELWLGLGLCIYTAWVRQKFPLCFLIYGVYHFIYNMEVYLFRFSIYLLVESSFLFTVSLIYSILQIPFCKLPSFSTFTN